MIDRRSSRPPHTVHCDVVGCQERFTGEPWQGMSETRRQARLQGWSSVVVRHNHTTGGLGTRRIDDFCPPHQAVSVNWAPKRRRA